MSPVLEVNAAAATSPGQVRDHNEDAFLAARPVFLVADGLGGHSRGEVASRTVVEAFESIIGREWLTTEDVVEVINEASIKIRALSSDGPAPGSTVSGVALTQQGGLPCWLVFNIGDSRTYLLHDGNLEQMTVDHSAVRRSAISGVVGLVSRNVITRALGAGIERPPRADQWLVPAEEGHRVLICSDGLTNEVTEQLIHACLLTEPDPQHAANRLVSAALEAGGRDNVTAVVVDAVTVLSDVPAAERVSDTIPDETAPDADAFVMPSAVATTTQEELS